MSDREAWHTDVDPKDPGLSPANVRLVFDEAKDCMLSTEKTYESLSNKAVWAFGFLLTLSPAITGYFLKKPTGLEDWLLLAPFALYASFGVKAGRKLIGVMKATNLGTNGYHPVKLFQMKTLGQGETEVLCRVTKRYGEKICHNLLETDKKAELLHEAGVAFVQAVTCLIVGFLVVRFLIAPLLPLIGGRVIAVPVPICSVQSDR
jgi:hypothetical protein